LGLGSATFEAKEVSSIPRPVVLVLVGFYPPAYVAGGPTRSVPRIVEQLADEFAFVVVTGDRDLGAARPLEGVVSDRWVESRGARCLYLSSRRRLGGLVAAVRGTRHEVLYLNSVFSLDFSLMPLWLRKLGILPRRGLVIAPRGELDKSALAIKRRRKHVVLWLLRALRLVDGAVWHAATTNEANAIARQFGSQPRVLVARDIPLRPEATSYSRPKEAGQLRVIYLGRIARIKNLEFAISVLRSVRGNITFDVYGPIEDQAYWAECQRAASELPANVTMSYCGLVAPDETMRVVGEYHLFFAPTRAESFGHAITEAFMAGCPVLISDQTPWRDLERRRAGWDLPLGDAERFAQAMDQFADMDQGTFDGWSAGAARLGREIAQDAALDADQRAIFRAAARRGSAHQPLERSPKT
jgi:glycosyltransferase involved in cell wall biosynthesis